MTKNITYTLRRSIKARSLRISVHPGGAVHVTVPHRESDAVVDAFIRKHEAWIHAASQKMSNFKKMPVSGRKDYLLHKEKARAFIESRVAHWNAYYGFQFNRIAIKDTKRLWGSCSRKGNLNFSYTLFFLPPELADYVVVHELCHLKEHNHGKGFWALVGTALPDFKLRRRELARFVR